MAGPLSPFGAAPPKGEHQGPRWFSIPAHRPFVEDLASGLLRAIPDPEALADAVVLTPTRRAARALAEAFVKVGGGKAVLLPQIRALGDLDEGEPPFEPGDVALDLPAAISGSRRRFELARLVADNHERFGRTLDTAGALEMADALGSFLDSCQIEEVDALGKLDSLVDLDMAAHFQRSADVLRIALEVWPNRLLELGLMDVSERRVALLRGLAEKWRIAPPEHPLVAAGSTGTAPATADLLAVVANAPRGAVVLPGLDEGLADDAWAQVGEQHPQGAMKRLLARAGVDRAQVADWLPDADMRGRWRRRVINEALRPADATRDWLEVIRRLREENADALDRGLDGLTVVGARNEEETALVCALLLREALETPDKTVALVTPDLDLSRRVSAQLTRWSIAADSSAGAPLSGYPAAVLASHVAALAAEPEDPIRLLAVMKHPLAGIGFTPEQLARRRRTLERYALRGPRPRDRAEIARRLAKAAEPRDGEPVAEPLRIALAEAGELAEALFAALDLAARPFADGPADAATAALALAQAMEALASRDLWAGAGGEAVAALLASVMEDGAGLPATDARGFAELLERLLSGETVRVGGATHPRLRILGAIEARLVRADRLILAGLEEGVWPREAPVDPFLSRPMRETLGLPPPERRIGLSAHDFAQAACAPEVILVHSERRGTSPAVESRWLWRLRTLAAGGGKALPERPDVLAWARALDAPDAVRPAPRPRPRPPVAARPKRLSVTRIERWLRDPYAIYAETVLGLKVLDRPDLAIGPRERGTAVHAALERFARDHSGDLPEEAEDLLRLYLIEALDAAGLPQTRMAREEALARNVAPWLADVERARRPGARLILEEKGELALALGEHRFTVSAKADRIEVRGASADILDFKTGRAPSEKQVKTHLAPQLTLTAAILREGGFTSAGAVEPGELVYVQVSGGRKIGEVAVRGTADESLVLADEARMRLERRAAAFFDVATPYISRAIPQFAGETGDYDHLARLWEWSTVGGEEGGE